MAALPGPVALYGRFRMVSRPALAARLEAAGGAIARDLTRASGALVVGAGSLNLVPGGQLDDRLARAAARGVPIHGERRFLALLDGEPPERTTVPADRVAPGMPERTLLLLHAFDVIAYDGGHVRFADGALLKQAAALLSEGLEDAAVIRALLRAEAAPVGRRRVVAAPTGEPALEWDDGLTDLAGQGLLPLGPVETVDELFEAAGLAEAEGDRRAAERLYAQVARADRQDPIAFFNLANLQAGRGALREAALHYRLAAARDPSFAEAQYNLAAVLERLGDHAAAERALEAALAVDKDYPDALFNLAQLRRARGDGAGARPLYRRYLATEPPSDWAAKARRALSLIERSGS